MNRDKYAWVIAFELFDSGGFDVESIVISEEDEDFKEVVGKYADRMISASLVNKETQDVIHHLFLEGYRFKRIFRRQEFDLMTRRNKTIPVIEVENDSGTLYGFTYEDSVIFTQDSKFYRGE